MLARLLHHAGQRVSVAVYYSGGQLESEMGRYGVRILPLGKSGRWDMVGFIMKCVQIVRSEQPHVIISYLPMVNILSLVMRAACPKAKVIWNIRSSLESASYYDWLRRASIWLEASFSRYATLIMVNSKRGYESALRRGILPSKLFVIPNGVDTIRFVPDLATGQKLRREWGVSPSEKLIGNIARLDPVKDHYTFLKAGSIICQWRDDIRFVCVGDGHPNYRKELKKSVYAFGIHKKVIWAGIHEDMTSVYNALDLLTLTSRSEGFPNVIAEAMACGIPCVSTDVGDAAEILQGFGSIVPVGDATALAQAWETQLVRHGTCNDLSRLMRERIVEKFSEQSLYTNTRDVLLKAVSVNHAY